MILKLQPYLSEKVWGGNKIRLKYGYNCSEHTGEAWGISGHESGSSIIKNGSFKGLTLRQLYQSKKDLFGNYPADEFPILVKVIDANDDLSIQVHPDNIYAKKHENSLGKTESWYIIETEKNTDIIIGHQAKTKQEFIKYIKEDNLESVLNKFSIKAGDAFNIHAGTIHAICKGTLLLEVQQSSDVTYRLYDYNRLSDGKLRELHIDKALDVIPFPDKDLTDRKPTEFFDYAIIEQSQKSLHKAHQYGDYIFIIEGKGKINQTPLKKGDFLMVSANDDYKLTGKLKYGKIQIN